MRSETRTPVRSPSGSSWSIWRSVKTAWTMPVKLWKKLRRDSAIVLSCVSLARYLVPQRREGPAEQLRTLAKQSKAFSAQDQVQLWRNLVPASLAADDFPQVERLCRLLMAQLPGDLRVHLEVFDLATQANDVKLMDTALDQVRRVESSGPISHYVTALRLVFSARENRHVPAAEPSGNTNKLPQTDKRRQAVLQQALVHLAESLRLRPNWSRR